MGFKKKQTADMHEEKVSWRSIEQVFSHRPLTPSAQRRRFLLWLKLVGISVGLIALLMGGLFFYLYWEKKGKTVAISGVTQVLDRIEFETDGALNESWIRQYLNLSEKVPLMSIDIFFLKQQLESLGQIQSATVERKFPKTLRIHLKERVPILKLAILNNYGKPILLFVAPDGHVYRGFGYPKNVIARLPYMSGIKLKRVGKGYASLEGIPAIAQLLKIAQSEKPHLYKDWKEIGCERFDPQSGAVWSSLRVVTRSYGEVIFGHRDFLEQLDRLDYILTNAQKNKLYPIERIDLSLDNPTLKVDSRRLGPLPRPVAH